MIYTENRLEHLGVICQSWLDYESDVNSVGGISLNKPICDINDGGVFAVEW